jgi:hypothetical protein
MVVEEMLNIGKEDARKRPSALRLSRGTCPRCGTRQEYYERYDAAVCVRCDQWLEGACGDLGCGYCRNRPARPSLARDHAPTEPALRRAARLASRGAWRSRSTGPATWW